MMVKKIIMLPSKSQLPRYANIEVSSVGNLDVLLGGISSGAHCGGCRQDGVDPGCSRIPRRHYCRHMPARPDLWAPVVAPVTTGHDAVRRENTAASLVLGLCVWS